MNLVIIDRCNRCCPYCFARSKVRVPQDGDHGPDTPIGLAEVEWFVEFLLKSGIRELKLLGGEPSLHPEFGKIVTHGLSRGLQVTIFTNGIWPDSVLDFFCEQTDSRVQFVFNLNEPSLQQPWETERQGASLAVAGRRASIGFNIYREDFDVLFTRELVDRFALKRQLRLGLASPIAGEANRFVSDEGLRRTGRRLASQLRVLESSDILGSFDCGFPLCMFDEADLGSLALSSLSGFVSKCGSPVDVGPDLRAWPCFPLSGLFGLRLRDFADCQAVEAYYLQKTAPLRSIGMMQACLTCKHLKRGQCCGGCLARTINAWMESGDTRVLEKLTAGQG